MGKKIKICHLSSVHPAFDERIFHKEAKTLLEAGYQVSLVIPYSDTAVIDGIKIVPLKKAASRFSRFTRSVGSVLVNAFREKADIYHFHDPELIPVGVLLKLFGKKVIYDVHEDYGQKILSKEWIPSLLRRLLSWFFDKYENFSSMLFDYVVTADSHTILKFRNRNKEVIANYPPISFASREHAKKSENVFKLIYAGGLSEIRGVRKMVEATECLNRGEDIYELHLLGNVSDSELEEYIKSSENVVYHGLVPWEKVNQYLMESHVGLVLLQPVPAYLYCPGENIVKLFEYMSVKLPVIISNFPKLKSLVTDVGCGVCVDPADPGEIANAARNLHDNVSLRQEMGEKGYRAFVERFNWEAESKKLIKLYEGLFNVRKENK